MIEAEASKLFNIFGSISQLNQRLKKCYNPEFISPVELANSTKGARTSNTPNVPTQEVNHGGEISQL